MGQVCAEAKRRALDLGVVRVSLKIPASPFRPSCAHPGRSNLRYLISRLCLPPAACLPPPVFRLPPSASHSHALISLYLRHRTLLGLCLYRPSNTPLSGASVQAGRPEHIFSPPAYIFASSTVLRARQRCVQANSHVGRRGQGWKDWPSKAWAPNTARAQCSNSNARDVPMLNCRLDQD